MRFSEKYSIRRNSGDDWYDTFLPADTSLFIDPFLIWNETSGFWSGAHSHLLGFFEMVFDLIRQSSGDEKSVYWKQAASLLLFPEPPEFCLGVAENSPLGIGSARGLQREMLAGIKTAISHNMNRISHMETISLFQGGMGPDRISDCVCNVLKSYFVNYTKDICARHDIPTEEVRLRNASWNRTYHKWDEEVHDLPMNDITVIRKGKIYDKRIPVLLTPERFLREMPVAEPNGFWRWSWSNMAEELRGNFNFDIATKVSQTIKAKMARQYPDAVALYLNHLESEDVKKEPYPIADDPHMLVNWYEHGAALTPEKDVFIPSRPDEFGRFVESVIDGYRYGIEDQDAWVLLWHGGRGLAERAVQALFRSVVIHYCRANNVDLTGESNAGRGPVDFKFSQGWSARALVETKLVRSSKFWDGLLAQQPAYQVAEGVRTGFFVAVGYTDNEVSDATREKLQRAAEITSASNDIDIKSVLIDARRKESASNLRDEELSDQLHRDGDDE